MSPQTSKQILARQAVEAKQRREAIKPIVSTAVAPTTTAVAVPDERTPREKYLDDIAPAGIVGRLIRFSKDGEFITADDEQKIDENADFIALADQTLIGWQRFHDEAPPDRRMGLLYSEFVMPPRESLGDNDPADWPAGLSGAPEDPWKHFIFLVLQGANSELFTFQTSSKTGRRAVGNLLRHYDRMARTHPDQLPVVKLKTGGFQHKDDRIGFVATPLFAVVGRAPRDSAGADLNDEIPFN